MLYLQADAKDSLDTAEIYNILKLFDFVFSAASFFSHVNLMYGVISEFCTSDTCATMTGPGNV